VVPPPNVVRWDGDDPYLVVAADKGTAHLSDTANALSKAYGFWLGDAFASGGSNGYDHKVVGITASPASEITAFAKEHNLNFDVLCDSMRRISEEWGALRNDNTARMTFIVNAKGVITHMFPRVDVWKHAAEVLTLFPQSSEAAATETPASTTAQAPAQVASSNAQAAAQAAAHPPVSAGHSAGPDLVAEAARAVLKLLLMHKQSGGAIPPDVSELLAQLGRNA
jgi:hypothetical protein